MDKGLQKKNALEAYEVKIFLWRTCGCRVVMFFMEYTSGVGQVSTVSSGQWRGGIIFFEIN